MQLLSKVNYDFLTSINFSMFPNLFRRLLHKLGHFSSIINTKRNLDDSDILIQNLLHTGVPLAVNFDYEFLKSKTLLYVDSIKVGNEIGCYRYSSSTTMPVLYSSTYACMIKSLYGELSQLSEKDRQEWIAHFDSFQSQDDGLFRDPIIANDLFENEDWWGARHLACHLIIAYTALKAKPRYDFYFLEPFYEPRFVREWLESRDWINNLDFVGNEVMNYGVLLQYSRGCFNNRKAGTAVKVMLAWLEKHIDPASGLWGEWPLDTPKKLSLSVQAAYHIYPLFFFDKRTIPYKEKIIDNVLKTQNKLGGYGVQLNSSACEDIDSIEPLIRLSQQTSYREQDIRQSLLRALPWVLLNMNEDGGFVFRRNDAFVYGHKQMASGSNESSMFATWFRTLSLAYLVRQMNIPNNYAINRCPGYEFP